MNRGRRVALVVGDTPGHLFPALAVATAYRDRHADIEIVFLGPEDSEMNPAVRNGSTYCPVPGAQLARVGPVTRLLSLIRTLFGVVVARRLLRERRTQLILGFGGYSSGAVVLAAKTLGLRTAISEGNVRAGLANRLLGRIVNRIYLASGDVQYLPRDRACVTGWPIRPEIAALGLNDRRREDKRRLRILVCSGSRGGEFFARVMPDLAASLRTRGYFVSVWHQCAEAPVDRVKRAYQESEVEARVTSFIDDIAPAYQWADFAITRGGAGVLAEIAAAALPSLIIPLPDAAENHQSWNARRFASLGGALWTGENEWDLTDASRKIDSMMSDPERWASASKAIANLSVPGAAGAIVDDCERMLNKIA